MADLADVVAEKRWRKMFPKSVDPEVLFEGFMVFATTAWYIRHPSQGKILFPISEEQAEAARRWITNRYCINLKARQVGWSTLCGCLAAWETFGWADRQEVMLSKGEKEAQKLLAKAKYGIKFMPKWMLAKGPKILANNTEKVAFDNDSSIESLPSADDPARGDTVYRVFVDEWGKLPNGEEAWASIEPVTDVGGRVVGLGTAEGWGDFFHQMWLEAELGENGFDPYFVPWSAAHHRDQAWYDAKAKTLKNRPWIMHREYPRNAAEAFMKSGNMVFELDLLLKQDEFLEAAERFNMLVASPKKWQKTADVEGSLRVWRMPAKGQKYAIGVDVAEGLDHGDYSVVQILHAITGEQVACWHGHVDSDLLGEEIVPALGYWYNTALVVPENNNMGVSTIKALQRTNYPLIYRQLRLQDRKEHKTEMFGFRTTRATKPFIISELNASLREESLILHDKETLVEMKTYVRNEKGQMGGSPHDDRVMALALAQEARRHVFLEEYRAPDDKPGKGTFAHYMGLVEAAKGHVSHRGEKIGVHNVRSSW